jgi:NET1-associated nuclear protein 1 (U3 small nucleolar RNA-associated protein 17)
MWHNLESAMHESPYSEAKTSVSTVHWHSAPVGSVCFSADGNHLLSGGLEAVLVIWQLSSGKRNYLPRLGGALVSISDSPDPVNYLVAQSDNTVRLINISSMRVDASIYGMLPPPKTASLPEAAGASPLAANTLRV